MDHYRCDRCHSVLVEVATGPGDATGLLVDPVVERRIASACALHADVCTGEIGPVPPKASLR
jgi:hypothetical protein